MSQPRMKNLAFRCASVLIGLAIVGTACSQSSSPVTTASASAPDTSVGSQEDGNTGESSSRTEEEVLDGSAASVLEREANPLPMVFTIESTGSTTTEMGPEGGEITTVAADGTRYTLSVPEGALLGVETITISPITLDESPFKEAAAFGVSMEPDGLVFFEPAVLEISGHSFERLTSVAFSSDHDGDDFGAQIAAAGENATIQVAHFSRGGFVEASEAEIDSIFSEYTPRSREGRHVQEIAHINQFVDDLDDRGAVLGSILESWFQEILAEASTANDAATVENLLGEFINARDHVKLLRTFDGGSAIGESTDQAMVETALVLQEAAVRLFDQENLRCIQDRDPDAMFAMLKWALLYNWLEAEIQGDFSRVDELFGAIKQCARFRVEFESSVAFEFSSEVTASVPLEFQTGGGELLLNSGTMTYPTIQGTLNGTAVAGKLSCTTQAPIDVALKLRLNPVFGRLSDSEFDGAAVLVRFYETNWVCGGTAMQQALWIPWFVGAFSNARVEDGFYEFDTERSSNAGVWAERSLIAFSNGVTVTVDIELVHDPQLP